MCTLARTWRAQLQTVPLWSYLSYLEGKISVRIAFESYAVAQQWRRTRRNCKIALSAAARLTALVAGGATRARSTHAVCCMVKVCLTNKGRAILNV